MQITLVLLKKNDETAFDLKPGFTTSDNAAIAQNRKIYGTVI